MEKVSLFSFKEGEYFKLYPDSPLVWKVIEFSPSCYSHSLRAQCINSPKNIIAPFDYGINVFKLLSDYL